MLKVETVVIQGAGYLVFDLLPGMATDGQFDGIVVADGQVRDEAVAAGDRCASVEYIVIHPVDRQPIASIKQDTSRSQGRDVGTDACCA